MKSYPKKQMQTQQKSPFLYATKKVIEKSTQKGAGNPTKIEERLIQKPSNNEIRYALRKSNPQNLDTLSTFHIVGFRKCKISSVKRIFADCGVRLNQIKAISFIGTKVLKIILFEKYITEFIHSLKDLESKPGCKGLQVEKINFDPFSKVNFLKRST